MTDQETLHQAIIKAVNNGYQHGHFNATVMAKHLISKGLEYNLIFSHDFAKAFWDNDPYYLLDETPGWAHDPGDVELVWKQISDEEYTGDELDELPAWQYHLQQMVLEEDPIKYLESFL